MKQSKFNPPPDALGRRCQLLSYVHTSSASYYAIPLFFGTWGECEDYRVMCQFPHTLKTEVIHEN
jgi:hypothetical protein